MPTPTPAARIAWIARSLRRRRALVRSDARIGPRLPTATSLIDGQAYPGGADAAQRRPRRQRVASREGRLPHRPRLLRAIGRQRDVPGLLDGERESLLGEVEVDERLHGGVALGGVDVRIDVEGAGERVAAVGDRLGGSGHAPAPRIHAHLPY